MINLITGLPGNGKTLFAIGFIDAWAKRENRPVFYSGITLTEQGKQELGWTEIDGLEWFTAPAGAIILIDEAQRVFRPRAHGREVPKHVEQLETHRHSGLDLVLITQHPMLIDNEVRRLAGNHRHVVRMMGMERATVHEWSEVRQDCEKGNRREDSNKTLWPYDKRVYELYKSAEVHTVKRRIPKIVYLTIGAFLAVVVAVGGMVYYSKKFTAKPVTADASSVAGPSADVSRVSPGRLSDKPVFDPIADAKQYVAMSTPRVQGLPQTAPKYDELTKPTAVPVPVACVASANKCLCYTQQGTRMDVRDQQCRDIAEFGYFQEFEPDGRREKSQQAARVLESKDRLPISGASTKDVAGTSSLSMAQDGYGVLGKTGPGVRVPSVEAPVQQTAAEAQPQPRVPANSPWRAS